MHADSPTPVPGAAATAATSTGADPSVATDAMAGLEAATGPGQQTSYVTGAYQLSGNHYIDQMIRLERALKTFGSPA